MRRRRKRPKGSGRRCSVCVHPQRLEIHQEIQGRGSIRLVGEKFQIPVANLYRHIRNNHAKRLGVPVITSPRRLGNAIALRRAEAVKREALAGHAAISAHEHAMIQEIERRSKELNKP